MAALGLRFTDGTTTITVTNGTTGILTNYRQGSANEEEVSSTDKVKVVLLSSLSTIQATVGSLNKLFRQARNFQRSGVGARVYVERDLGDSTWWRSEILDALPVPVDSTLDSGIATGKLELELVFTRVNYWEGAETQIPLTNTNGTDNTSGLTIYSIDDSQAGKDNFVDIDGVNDVTGDLPAGVKLEIKNTYNDSLDKTTSVVVAVNRHSQYSGTFVTHVLEGESASGITALPASADYTLYSNGKYGEDATDTAAATISWNTLDDTFLKRAAGNYFRVCAVLPDYSSGVWMKARISLDGNLYVLAETPYTLLDSEFVDLGVIQIPPNFLTGLAYDTLYFDLVHKRLAGADTINLDCVMLLPLDSWRRVDCDPQSLAYNYYLVIDEINDRVYQYYVTGSYAQFSVVGYGGPLTIEPGVNQRMYIVPVGGDFAVRTASVKLWYRPRRLVI